MRRKNLVAAFVLTGALVVSWTQSAAAQQPVVQQASATFTSTIYSPATSTCIDVPGNTTDTSVRVVSQPCSGTSEQSFIFYPVAGQPDGTYAVVDPVNGLCVSDYRNHVVQDDCLPVASQAPAFTWTLVAIDAAAKKYVFVPTYQFGATNRRCMSVSSLPPSNGILYTGVPTCRTTDPYDFFVVAGIS
ncbi:MAG: Ricin-type beta-trefoil lectin domain-like [Actinoplanes sp.]|jgi:hypothetical protein|nr:Ricin-type beta-trefoil lectin domain-like [Actinoplanes sp.]